jgi:hypothetical protein
VPLVSMRAYARHRRVSLKPVQKGLGSGRIETRRGLPLSTKARLKCTPPLLKKTLPNVNNRAPL